MKRPEHFYPHENGDRWWHVWCCAECRHAHRVDREIRRRLKAAFDDVFPSPDLDARILAAMGFPPETEEEPEATERDRPRRLLDLSRRVNTRVGRRALIVGALAAVITFLYLSTQESAAQPLERVLAAMARVRTAHCSGWFVSYEHPTANVRWPPDAQMRVDWWYQAPGRFRREMGPEVPEWSFPPGALIVNGEQSVFHNWRDGGPPQRKRRQMHDLSPVDFFTAGGLLRRAAGDKHARIEEEARTIGSGSSRVLSVTYEQGGERFPMRFRWKLTVDETTDRVVQAEWRAEWRDGGRWRTGATATLDRFEYDIAVAEELFRFETVHCRRSAARE